MSLGVEARLYKWVCYRCAREILSPADARCPDCAFSLVIECDESPAVALWRDETVQAQRALRIPAPLLTINACHSLAEITESLPPPEVGPAASAPGTLSLTPASAEAVPRSPEEQPKLSEVASSLKQSFLVFAGVALATFIVGCAVATMIRYGF